MRDIGWIALVSVAIPLLAILVPIWPATNASKLGQFQYRWGLYVTFETLLASISFCVDAFRNLSVGGLMGCAGLLVMAISAFVASVGIFQRRRWGVIAFVVAFALSLILPTVYAGFGTPLRGRITGEGIIVFVFLMLSLAVFPAALGIDVLAVVGTLISREGLPHS